MEAKHMKAMTARKMVFPEARECADQIRANLTKTRQLVLDLYEREGWAALGYLNWRACVTAEFQSSQAHLYRQLEAAQTEKVISPIGEMEIPESQLRPLTKLKDNPEAQREAWQQAVATAPEGKVTAKHVESVVREIKESSLKTYRIRDIAANEWWEGKAKTPESACEAARGNSLGSSKAKWNVGGCDIKEKTLNGAGGWKNVKIEAPETAQPAPEVTASKKTTVPQNAAMDLAAAIISQLEGLSKDDPAWREAVDAVYRWCQKNIWSQFVKEPDWTGAQK